MFFSAEKSLPSSRDEESKNDDKRRLEKAPRQKSSSSI